MTMALAVGLTTVALTVPSFASAFGNPAEVYSELSGQTPVEAWEEKRDADKTFGQLAEENGFGDAFKEAIQSVHEERVSELLEEGKITVEQAESILLDLENCEGEPGTHAGTHNLFYGGGYGQSGEYGLQNGEGKGHGRGQGGLRDGSGFGGRWNSDTE